MTFETDSKRSEARNAWAKSMRHEQDEDAPPDKDPNMLTRNIPVRLEIKVTPGRPGAAPLFLQKERAAWRN